MPRRVIRFGPRPPAHAVSARSPTPPRGAASGPAALALPMKGPGGARRAGAADEGGGIDGLDEGGPLVASSAWQRSATVFGTAEPSGGAAPAPFARPGAAPGFVAAALPGAGVPGIGGIGGTDGAHGTYGVHGTRGIGSRHEAVAWLAACAADKALVGAGLLLGAAGRPFGVAVACGGSSHVAVGEPAGDAVAEAIAARLGLPASALTIASGASASFDALALAADAIRRARAERMLVIGIDLDGPVSRRGRALPRRAAHGGGVFEGASAVVLESLRSSERRTGPRLARIVDYTFVPADAGDHHALFRMLARHARKTLYLAADSFLRPALCLVFDLQGSLTVDAGPPLPAACSSLLQLAVHCERQAAAGTPLEHGAVIVSGGGRGDRGAGVLVVEGAAPARRRRLDA